MSTAEVMPQEEVHGVVEELVNDLEGVTVQETKLDQANGHASLDFELHRACESGNVDEVRSILSKGLQSVETLGE